MKTPDIGELWLDEQAWKVTGKPRLLLVTGFDESDTIRAVAVTGGSPGPGGVPGHYFRECMSWQGYWSTSYRTLPRLIPPYSGTPLETMPATRNAAKLSGTADLINSIVPSLQPSDVQAYDKQGHRVSGAVLNKPASYIPAGIPYLQFSYGSRLLSNGLSTPPQLRELWFQKQGNAWYLVRMLAVAERPPAPRWAEVRTFLRASELVGQPRR